MASLISLKTKSLDLYLHSMATAETALRIAGVLSQNDYSLEEVRNAALLHDIGKINIPMSILEKRGSLDEGEWEIMRFHPQWGAEMLLTMQDARIVRCSAYVIQHHEKPDGTGYPGRRTLDQIHPAARIINIADRFVAMTEDRAYRKAFTPECAIEALRDDVNLFFPTEYWRIIDCLVDDAVNPCHPLGQCETGEIFAWQ
jgi:putative nucleotidyltransferase with HDIG domain